MVGLGHAHRLSLTTSSRSSTDDARQDPATQEEETVVEPDQGNEPKSMLERITNFMQHPETLLPMPTINDPVQRFVSVVKFYLSGWHIKSLGVKKPLNPILGERFTCYWEYLDDTRGFYISEQTSHHPPKSSYFYMCPEHYIRIDGTLKPRSKFLGNSAASMMEGIAILRLLNQGKKPGGERYILTQPNMYARGILFGKMKYELGDHSFVRCPENNLIADIEFKTKGYFGGTYNAIGGVIRNEQTQEILYELSGLWNGEMFVRDISTGHRELLFDATHAKPTPPLVRAIDDQEERESQRLWSKVITALKERNHDTATDEKSAIEERQRVETATRAADGIEWKPRLFRPVHGGPGGSEEGDEDLDWILNTSIDGETPEEQEKQILSITAIVQGQKSDQRFEIPSRESLESRKSHDACRHGNDEGSISDLIDFSDDHDPAPRQQQQHHPAVPLQPPQRAQEPLNSYQMELAQALHPDNGKNPPRGNIVSRKDTETNEIDEFMDAEDGLAY